MWNKSAPVRGVFGYVRRLLLPPAGPRKGRRAPGSVRAGWHRGICTCRSTPRWCGALPQDDANLVREPWRSDPQCVLVFDTGGDVAHGPINPLGSLGANTPRSSATAHGRSHAQRTRMLPSIRRGSGATLT